MYPPDRMKRLRWRKRMAWPRRSKRSIWDRTSLTELCGVVGYINPSPQSQLNPACDMFVRGSLPFLTRLTNSAMNDEFTL